jgi:hypothetical protein
MSDTTDNAPFYLNPSGVLSAGQSDLRPEGGYVPPGTKELPEKLQKEEDWIEGGQNRYRLQREAAYGKLHQIERQRPAIPNQQQLGPPPDARDYQKHSGAWLGAMAMIGALAAKSGRVTGTAALSAFSGAMKGWQEGNLEAYTNAAEKWKNENARTIENNRQLLEKYQMVLDNYRLNIDQQRGEIERLAVENHDNIAFRLMREQHMLAFAQLQDKRDEWTNGPRGAQATADKLAANHDAVVSGIQQKALELGPIVGWNAENIDRMVDPNTGQPWTNEQKQRAKGILQWYAQHGFGTGGSARLQQAAIMQQRAPTIADAIMSGKQPPTLTGMQRGEADAVRSELASRGFDLAKADLEYKAAVKQIQSLNGPQMTRYAGLATSVVNSIDRLKETSRQMDLGGLAGFNKLELETLVSTQGNTPEGKLAARYMADVNTVKEEFANLANGGYAPTEPAWKLADQQINGNYGVGALGSSLDEVQMLINFRLNAIPGFRTMGPGSANRYMGGGGVSTPPPASGGDMAGKSDEELKRIIGIP